MARKPQKKKIPFAQILLVLLILPGLYVAVQLYRIFTPGYGYETAVLATLSDSIECDGVVLFQETYVEGGGELGYLAEDGARVSVGTAVAEVYTSASQAGLRTRLKALDSQIALLEKSQNTSSAQLSVLLSQRSTAVYDLLDAVGRAQLANTAGAKESYLLAQNKMQITTGEAADFSPLIASLNEEKSALEASLGTPEIIAAPVGGYFISSDSMQTLSLSEGDVLELDAAGLAQLLADGAAGTADGLAGKIVSSYQWYFAGVCSLADSARFENRSSVTLSFPGKAEKELPATIVSVEKDEAGSCAKFVLRCEYMGADVLKLGQETAQITFASYTGLRVSADAVHLVEDTSPASSSTSSSAASAASAASSGAAADSAEENLPVLINGTEYCRGVYVKYGNIARFRKIEILYQDAHYVLVRANGAIGSDSEVRLYDEIILTGQDLYDGKLL